MPLRNVILESSIDPEDADLLESLFNQFCESTTDEQLRRDRAARLVKVFTEGERDREVLARVLVSSRHSKPDCAIEVSVDIHNDDDVECVQRTLTEFSVTRASY